MVAIVLIEAATMIGASFLYWVARRGGRTVLLRYGKYLQLDADRLTRAEDFYRRRGFLAIVIGRLTPGLRIASTVTAGALGVPYRVFFPACLIGSNNLLFFLLGLFAGPGVLDAIAGVRFSVRFLTVLGGLVVLVVAYLIIRRRAHLTQAATELPGVVRLETAVLAGLFAVATTALVLNMVLYLAAGMEQETRRGTLGASSGDRPARGRRPLDHRARRRGTLRRARCRLGRRVCVRRAVATRARLARWACVRAGAAGGFVAGRVTAPRSRARGARA